MLQQFIRNRLTLAALALTNDGRLMMRMRLFLTLALVITFIGCSRSGSDIIPVSSDDPAMHAEIQKARDSFPEFWRQISEERHKAQPLLIGCMVKASFDDPGGAREGAEHMWVSHVEYDGHLISGVLEDTPDHLKSVEHGQKVSFPLDKLSDWLYVQDGKAVGAFTVKLLRSRMTEAERKEHDSNYPFTFE